MSTEKKGARGGKRPGTGRKPKKNPKKNKTLKLALKTHKQLEHLSENTGISQAVIIEKLVEKASTGRVKITPKNIEKGIAFNQKQ